MPEGLVSMGDIKWIKITTDIFNNRKIRQIEKTARGDSIIVIWFKLLCLAGKTNDCGLIYLTPEVPFTDEMLAVEFNRPVGLIRQALNIFKNFDMITIENERIALPGWEEYQNSEYMQRVQEQNRERKRRQRAKQNIGEGHASDGVTHQDKSRDGHVTVTHQNKKENKNNTPISPLRDIFAGYSGNLEVLAALDRFAEMRREKKKPLTERAACLLLKKLDSFCGEYAAKDKYRVECLDASVMNSWQGIFPLKEFADEESLPEPVKVTPESDTMKVEITPETTVLDLL